MARDPNTYPRRQELKRPRQHPTRRRFLTPHGSLVRSQISFVKPFFHPHEDRDSSTVFLDRLLAPDAMSSGGMEVVCIEPKNEKGQLGSDTQLADSA